MNAITATQAGTLGAAGLAAIVVLAAAAAWTTTAGAVTADDATAHREQHREMFQAHMKARLGRMAERLEIKASQQPAWGDFVKAREAMMGPPPARPAPDADAATLVRARAGFVAERAAKLATLADATAKLQAVLDPNQQKTLNEIVRHAGHQRHHGQHGGMPHHGRGPGGEQQRPPR